MRRFAVAYLTTALACILMANLVLIILYGRQFYALEPGVDSHVQAYFSRPETLITNFVLIALFGFLWLLIRRTFGRET